MKKFNLLIVAIFSLLFGNNLFAQERAVAVVLPYFVPQHTASYEMPNQLIPLLNSKGIDHMVYRRSNDKIMFDSLLNSKAEQVSRYMMVYEIDIIEDYYPELEYVKDTNGVVKTILFRLSNKWSYYVKIIDLETSEIVQVIQGGGTLADNPDKKIVSAYPVDANKHFGTDPRLLRKNDQDKYFKLLLTLRNAHRDRFTQYYRAKVQNAMGAISLAESQIFNKGIVRLEKLELEKEKLKEFIIPRSSGFVATKGQNVKVFTIDTIGNYIMSPGNLGSYEIDSLESSGWKVSNSFMSSGKDAAAAHIAGKPLYCSLNTGEFAEKMGDKAELIPVSVTGLKEHTARLIEMQVMGYNFLRLMDKTYAKDVEYFQSRYRSGDFAGQKFELRPNSSKYIFIENSVDISDVAAGTVLYSFQKKKDFDGMYDATLIGFKQEMEIVQEIEKKEKTKAVVLYSPCGFSTLVWLEVFKVTQEKVGDKTIDRLVKIADANTSGSEQQRKISTVNISRGESDFYEASKNGDKIVFRQRVSNAPAWLKQ